MVVKRQSLVRGDSGWMDDLEHKSSKMKPFSQHAEGEINDAIIKAMEPSSPRSVSAEPDKDSSA